MKFRIALICCLFFGGCRSVPKTPVSKPVPEIKVVEQKPVPQQQYQTPVSTTTPKQIITPEPILLPRWQG